MELVRAEKLSPAKINLMLRVLGRRLDGYHQLQTCFQLLDWGDSIEFIPRKTAGSCHIEIKGFEGLSATDNLIYQAAQMLVPWAKRKTDWLIQVDKKIPFGAGLGGGSSNAATVLKFLNNAWKCDLSRSELLELALKLGADVPVFVLGKSALAGGVGEDLTPMSFNTPFVLLMFPDCKISTSELFAAPDLVRDQAPLAVNQIQQRAFWINDFMPVVLNKFSSVFRVYEFFQGMNLNTHLRLSGSGSTLFALFDDLESGQMAYDQVVEYCPAQLVKPL